MDIWFSGLRSSKSMVKAAILGISAGVHEKDPYAPSPSHTSS